MDQTSKREKLEERDIIKKRVDLEIKEKEIKKEREKKEIREIEEGVKMEERIGVVRKRPPAVELPIASPRKSALQKEIEDILEEGLEEIYQSMSPIQQKEFRERGEEIAFKISILIKQVKIKIKQILKLIIGWLKLIPGVNRFFLEQETKIKTDKILLLKKSKQI